MSMLAEGKRKQKWSLNPRGNLWSKDKNKFGQKMLEKMGWSEGKGLGANEDGIKEHVRASNKVEKTGFGFKDKEGWTEHESNFSKVLQDLGGNSPDFSESKPKMSIEKASKSSRARVHYSKFTRGKDLSQYSQKDLANIFGKKSLESDASGAVGNYRSKPESDEEPKTFGFGFNGTESQANNNMVTKSKIQKDESLANDEPKPFGFGYKSNDVQTESKVSFVSYVSATDKGNDVSKKKTKSSAKSALINDDGKKIKKKKNMTDTDGAGISNPDVANKCKKKSKSELVVETNHHGFGNPNFSESFNSSSLGETIENNLYEVIRKKKSKTVQVCNSQNFTKSEAVEANEDLYVTVKRKKTKSKGCNNPNVIEDTEATVIEFEVVNKKKKISKGCDNPNFSELPDTERNDSIETVDNLYEVIRRKKKKKTKSEGSGNQSVETKIEEDPKRNENLYEVVRVKKSKGNGCANPNFNDSLDNHQAELANGSAYEVTRSQKTNEGGVVNDALNLTEPDCDIMLNVTDEPPPQPPAQKKRKNKYEWGGAQKRVRFSEQQELYDINTTVLEAGIKANEKNSGFVNNGFFDMKTIDRIDFGKEPDFANKGYNAVQESVDVFGQGSDAAQAEIENDINEGKDEFVGELCDDEDAENEATPEGTKLRYRFFKFTKPAGWQQRSNTTAPTAKKSYAHLIRGDITLYFKNTNLHEVKGYAVG